MQKSIQEKLAKKEKLKKMSAMAGTNINMDQISAKNSIAAALKEAMLQRTLKAMEE